MVVNVWFYVDCKSGKFQSLSRMGCKVFLYMLLNSLFHVSYVYRHAFLIFSWGLNRVAIASVLAVSNTGAKCFELNASVNTELVRLIQKIRSGRGTPLGSFSESVLSLYCLLDLFRVFKDHSSTMRPSSQPAFLCRSSSFQLDST